MHSCSCITTPRRCRRLPLAIGCRGLEAMLHQRRKLLQYLRRTSFDQYAVLISRIGLKDSYGPQVGAALGHLPACTPAGLLACACCPRLPALCCRRWERLLLWGNGGTHGC